LVTLERCGALTLTRPLVPEPVLQGILQRFSFAGISSGAPSAVIVFGMHVAAPPTRTSAPAELTGWLRGAWEITRRINGGTGHFEGRARFSADPATPEVTIWQEQGRLRLGAHDGPAARTLRIEPATDGAWQVRFADGRPFHPLELTGGSWDVTHLCGADVYRGHFEVQHDDRFTVTWRVTGPHKDDVIVSVYVRAA
jgi:hypothetical protein